MTQTIRPLPPAGNTDWYGHYQDVDLAVRELQTSNPASVVYAQPTPSGGWTIPHTLGRLPVLACFDLSGNRIHPDEFVTASSVTLVFATPTAGVAVLT